MGNVELGRLIAEGSEAASLTGLTPMQLVKQVEELVAALQFVDDADLCSQVSGDRGLALYECGNVARAAMKKARGQQRTHCSGY